MVRSITLDRLAGIERFVQQPARVKLPASSWPKLDVGFTSPGGLTVQLVVGVILPPKLDGGRGRLLAGLVIGQIKLSLHHYRGGPQTAWLMEAHASIPGCVVGPQWFNEVLNVALVGDLP